MPRHKTCQSAVGFCIIASPHLSTIFLNCHSCKKICPIVIGMGKVLGIIISCRLLRSMLNNKVLTCPMQINYRNLVTGCCLLACLCIFLKEISIHTVNTPGIPAHRSHKNRICPYSQSLFYITAQSFHIYWHIHAQRSHRSVQ